MSRQKRKHAENIIVEAIEKLYPDLKVRPTTGNYILNQLLKAGYTNDEISCTPEEVKEDLAQAAFACNTSEAEDFSKLKVQPMVLSNKDFDILAKALADPPKANKKLQKLFQDIKKGDAALLSSGPRPEQNVIITNVRPAVHFTVPGQEEISPCGDANEESAVTNNDFEVTCEKCKAWLKKPTNPKG